MNKFLQTVVIFIKIFLAALFTAFFIYIIGIILFAMIPSIIDPEYYWFNIPVLYFLIFLFFFMLYMIETILSKSIKKKLIMFIVVGFLWAFFKLLTLGPD